MTDHENMSSPSPIADGNHTQKVELQEHNGSAKYSMVLPKFTDQEQEENDSPGNEIMANNHQVIDLACPSSFNTLTYPFLLSFNKLSYSVKVRPNTWFRFSGKGKVETKTKMLLDNISGEAREGEIMAVLGASGSGKSTLIDALAGRIEKESLKGTTALNGEALESRLLKIISTYVMQDDLLFPMLTVEETLMFSAEFRLPRSVSKQKKHGRVQTLIDQLGLRSVAKTVIGDEGHRGVSGGERRRVSIGINIIHDPILLFLDEPTSGLDSTSAFMVVKVLQRIARSGSIVIMSIHQPSYRLVTALDNLIFLSNGKIVYSGKPTNLRQYFMEFGHPVPENENPTEFVLDLIRELEETPRGITNLVDFNKSWHPIQYPNNHCDKSSDRHSLQDAIKASISRGKLVVAAGNTTTTDVSNLTSAVPTFANPYWIEMMVLAKRRFTNLRRMPELFGIRFGIILAIGLILGSLFWKVDDSQGSQGRIGLFTFMVIFIFCICQEEAPAFLQEHYIFIRETSYNSYRSSSYVLTHTLVSIPLLTILSLVFAVTTFWSVGLSGAFTGFFFFFITIFASFWAASSFLTLVAGLVPRLILALTVAGAFLSNFFLLSGIFIPRNSIPPYFTWLHYLSIVKYPYQGFLQNEYNNPAGCLSKGMQLFEDTPLAGLPEATKNKLLDTISTALGVNMTSSSSCVITGMKLLEQRGVLDISKWNCFWITIAWGILLRVLFYFTLVFGSKNRRK